MRSSILDMSLWANPPPTGQLSHHVRHVFSRRTFLGSVAGVAGATLGAGLFPANVLAAKSRNAAPKPTSNTTTLNGVTFSLPFFGPGSNNAGVAATYFGPGIDPSSIGDFNGFVGVADVQGTGTATNPDGTTETLLFDTDMRFMTGVYVGQDGAVHKGTFGFV